MSRPAADVPTASLDERLRAALSFIRADTHADIGSDHARLPVALVRSGRVGRCVIVEKTAGPLETARSAVQRERLQDRIDVRLGDGLSPLAPGEVHSVSLTGMGARTIEGIVNRAAWLPGALVVQPNDQPERLRAWALNAGYHLTGEALAPGFWTYPVLAFEHVGPKQGRAEDDPAYAGLPRDVAVRYGPHLLRRADPLLAARLHAEHTRLKAAAAHGRPQVLRDLDLTERALALIGLEAH